MDENIHLSEDKARAGETPHIVRYVLGASLALIIVVMLVVFLWGTNG